MATRVLAVDDDLSILEIYRLLLEPEGYEVCVAEQVYEHMTDVKQLDPDLIILDLRMGVQQEDGWHFLRALKASPFTTSIPLILCTASVLHGSEQERYVQEHDVVIIYKPFDIENLLTVVGRLLSVRR